MKHFRYRSIGAFAVLAMLVSGCGGPSSASENGSGNTQGSGAGETHTVSVGLLGLVTDAGILVAEEKGYFEDQRLQVNLTRFKSAAEMVGPLAAGRLDVGGGSFSAGLVNARQGGSKISIVADKGSWGEKTSGAILTSPKHADQIKSVKDLSGRTLAISARGTLGELLPFRALKEAGVDMSSVKLSEMSNNDMIIALQQGAVDAAVIFDPQLTTALQKNAGTLWKDGSEIWPQMQQAELFYGSKISEESGVRFMKAYLCGVQEYNRVLNSGDEQQISGLYELLSKSSNIPVELLRETRPIHLAKDGQVRVDDLQRQADYLYELGHITKPVDAATFVDTTFAEKASADLSKCGTKQ
jgi:NitT/TauT family transport system substrate-binding protein